jgi:hypothetical protein
LEEVRKYVHSTIYGSTEMRHATMRMIDTVLAAQPPAAQVETFDVMATIDPDYAESFERPKCKLCGLEDGACICAHMPPRFSAQAAPEIAAYRWRFRSEGEWSRWIMLDVDQIGAFQDIQAPWLDSGYVELQPIYAAPPQVETCSNCGGTQRAIYFSEQSMAHEERECHVCRPHSSAGSEDRLRLRQKLEAEYNDLIYLQDTGSDSIPLEKAMDIAELGLSFIDSDALPQTVSGPEILEASENLNGHQMMTVQSSRGEEYVIDADVAVKALAQLFSDYDNEKRFGWQLGVGWFDPEIKKLRASVVTRPQSGGEA